MTGSSVFYATSLDKVKQRQTTTPVFVHGEKRNYEEHVAKAPHGTIFKDKIGTTTTESVIKRPRLQAMTKSRIKASRICSIDRDSNTPTIPQCHSQRAPLPSSGLSQNPLFSLHHPRYGLPEKLVKNLAALGINSIYPWQSSCLLGHGLLDGNRNLVYTAPTGGGKSLVADVLMLMNIINNSSKKAILILPYVALVQEKLKWLRKAVDGVSKKADDLQQDGSLLPLWKQRHESSIRVMGLFGGSRARVDWPDFDVAVCTIEKANGLVNSAIEDSTIGDLGVIVLDELHMVNDDQRGYLMELTASKVLSLEHKVQIVGMSATLTNTEILAKWLDAKYYNSKHVPVPVEEFLVYDRLIYPTSTSSTFLTTASQLNSTQKCVGIHPIRQIQMSDHIKLNNPMTDSVVALAIETAIAGFGALVFCSGRSGCQTTANLISEAMPHDVADRMLDRRQEVISELRSLSVGLDEVLGKTIARGVAFHHAGLTTEERDIIANAYDEKIIKVIVATCSLAAGINLPARRVILQGARMGRDLIGPAMLRQMRGRAGRKGKDEIGESYLCCQKDDLEDVTQLLEADLPMIESILIPEKRGVKRALLEVIAIRLATHLEGVEEYINCTLLYHTMDHGRLKQMTKTALEELVESNMVSVDRFGSYKATRLSQAIVAAFLTPEDGAFLYGELQRALRAFVMDGEMHMFYTFTPLTLSAGADINWVVFRKEIGSLDESDLRVLGFVGVNPGFVNRMANSATSLPETTSEEICRARIYRRFYVALQLRDLCNEIPIHIVARKFEVSRGSVQTLAQVGEGFAVRMINFCDRMGWGMLKAALEHMSDRLKAGARADLLELARIPFVKSRTARVFWENGLKSLRIVAEAEAKDLVPVLLMAQPKRARLDFGEEEKYEQKILLKAQIIVGAASRLWEREQQQQQIEIEADL